MRKHRRHNCYAWDESDNIIECYNLCCKLESCRLSEEQITDWCAKLQNELLASLEGSNISPVVDKMKCVFGENNLPSKLSNKCYYKNWISKNKQVQSKKWNTISKIVQALPGGTPLPDFDNMLIKLPDVAEVVNFVTNAKCFENCDCCDDNDNARSSFTPRNGFGGGGGFGYHGPHSSDFSRGRGRSSFSERQIRVGGGDRGHSRVSRGRQRERWNESLPPAEVMIRMAECLLPSGLSEN